MTFRIERASNIPSSCIPYLEQAINRPPESMETIESVQARLDYDGKLFLIKSGEEIYGILFAVISYNPRTAKNVFVPVLIGGRDMELWKNELWEFINHEVKANNLEFMLMGRSAWGKVFPKLKKIGTIYTL